MNQPPKSKGGTPGATSSTTRKPRVKAATTQAASAPKPKPASPPTGGAPSAGVDSKPHLWRFQHVIAVVGVLVAITAVVVTYTVRKGGSGGTAAPTNASAVAPTTGPIVDPTDLGPNERPVITTSPSAPPAVDGSSEKSGTTTAPTTATSAGDAVGLGNGLAFRTAACRLPTAGSGSDWQAGPVTFKSRQIDALSCNMLQGRTGSVFVDVQQRYTGFTARLGIADGSAPTHAFVVEVYADSVRLDDQTFTLAATSDVTLAVPVSGVRTLELRFTEAHGVGGDDALSKPFVGAPTLLTS